MAPALPRPRTSVGAAGALVAGDRADSHDLDVDAPRARAVELGEQDRLKAAQGELPAPDPHRHAAPQQGRPQMRGGIAALAVGVPGIVVAVAPTWATRRSTIDLRSSTRAPWNSLTKRAQVVCSELTRMMPSFTSAVRRTSRICLVMSSTWFLLLAQHREGLSDHLQGLHVPSPSVVLCALGFTTRPAWCRGGESNPHDP